MGLDVAVCFVEADLTVSDLCKHIHGSAYLVVGRSRYPTGAPWRCYFALWDDAIDLESLCRAVSAENQSRLCIAWKAEHGGVAGYMGFASGELTTEATDDGPDYLRTPLRGVEVIFGVNLSLARQEALTFPELMLDDSVSCYSVSDGVARGVPVETLQLLLEGELEVEAVLPASAA